MMNHWYLIQFKPNSHRLAAENLGRQGFDTFLPLQKITKRQASRFVTNLRPLFPGYMFVCADSKRRPWSAINSTRGVSKLVTLGEKPTPLPHQLIPKLISQCDAKGILQPAQNLNVGDSVEMLTGPFAKFIATVQSIDPSQRVWLLIELMGKERRLRVSKDQLKQSDH